MKGRLAFGIIGLAVAHGLMPSAMYYLIYTGGYIAFAAPLLSVFFTIFAVRIVPGDDGMSYWGTLLLLVGSTILGVGVILLTVELLTDKPISHFEPKALLTYAMIRVPFDFLVALFRKRPPKQFQ